MQPGTIFSKWERLCYAGFTTLGLVTTVAAVLAILYTSAAAALVQPQLRFESESAFTMKGLVRSSLANPGYLEQNCSTPRAKYDQAFNDSLMCMGIQQSEDASRKFNASLHTRSDRTSTLTERRLTFLLRRPKGTSTLSDGTLVIPSWLDNNRSAAVEEMETSIVANNVSLALPHKGVISASRDPINDIVQPEDLDELGSYDINASVSSPVLHTLCATVSQEHLLPLMADRYNLGSGSGFSGLRHFE